jgi:hypothetical protein
MANLRKWCGQLALCAVFVGAPVEASTFGSASAPSPVAPGGTIRVSLTLEEPFLFLTMDAAATLPGELFVLPTGAPRDVPFTSEVLETVLEEGISGTLREDGTIAFASLLKLDFFNPPDSNSPTEPWAGSVLFAFDLPVAAQAQPGAYEVLFSFIADDGVAEARTGAARLDLVVAEIPEPATWALMLAGLAALGFMARRRIA